LEKVVLVIEFTTRPEFSERKSAREPGRALRGDFPQIGDGTGRREIPELFDHLADGVIDYDTHFDQITTGWSPTSAFVSGPQEA
jgi:hypothetical protein